MRINNYFIFEKIVEQGSMNGQKIHISQPSLSKAIRELEIRNGYYPLFQRVGNTGITLTGRRVLVYARQVPTPQVNFMKKQVRDKTKNGTEALLYRRNTMLDGAAPSLILFKEAAAFLISIHAGERKHKNIL